MKLKRVDTINVIPFIDIMLVLLVIVLTTATFMQKSAVAVDIPKAQKGDTKRKTTPTMITIKKDGTLFFNKEKTTPKALRISLSKLSTKDTIELHGDQKSNFEDFVKIMQLLKELKHSKVFIVTQH